MRHFPISFVAVVPLFCISSQKRLVEGFTAPSKKVLVSTPRLFTSTLAPQPSSLKSTSLQDESSIEVNATLGPLTTKGIYDSENFLQQQGYVSDALGGSMNSQSMPTSWLESLVWRGAILFLCALWASNFAAAKLVMAEPGVDSSLYALARFGVAATALAPGALGAAKRANMDAETLKAALKCGSWVAFGYLGQTLGLMTTTASKSCVICSLHCVFVAVIAELWRVQRCQAETKFDLTRLMPAALAVLGVAIVELKGAGGAPTIGDALSFAQPIGFGMGYLQLEEIMSKKPEAALPVSALKLLVVAFASFGMFELSPLVHGASEFALQIPDFTPILSSKLALGGILYTGLVTTAFALWVESIAFAKVPATDASIILTMEPLIAAGFGAIALGETFGSSDYLGAALIIGACALAVLLNTTPEDNQPVKEL
jgi:drug/metabolite transporter (DMT)-like permease